MMIITGAPVMGILLCSHVECRILHFIESCEQFKLKESHSFYHNSSFSSICFGFDKTSDKRKMD